MAGRVRRRQWRRNCRRMYDRMEHSDSWAVNPACRTPSSLSLISCMYFGFALEKLEQKMELERRKLQLAEQSLMSSDLA